jgi:osmotically inducible protein OsmC
MALSFGLARAGYSGDTLETSAEVTLDQVEGGFEISKSALTLTGKVPGISAEEFAKIAKEAEMNCPVSKLLDCEITLEHNLES